ncbi:MAG: hypothetical protein U0997_06535 [Sulfurimicrobium sp.]|nr:hypothetical protein [Sulfurimicrobium sp.]
MYPHAGDDGERACDQVGAHGGDIAVRDHFQNHQVAAADGERGQCCGAVVALVDVEALEPQGEHGDEGAGEDDNGGHGYTAPPSSASLISANGLAVWLLTGITRSITAIGTPSDFSSMRPRPRWNLAADMPASTWPRIRLFFLWSI